MSAAHAIKRFLYRHLPLEKYLRAVSRIFFIGLRLGLGRRSAAYEYPRYLARLVRPGDVCLDIGANLGYFSRTLSRLAGPSGKVFAIEPVPPVLRVLRHNLRRCPNVEIVPFALGAENRPVLLRNDSARMAGYLGTGRNYIVDDAETDEGDMEFEAQMRRGSELFGRLPRLDFVKCDVEGYERIVIEDLAPVIQRHLPIVMLETSGPARREMIERFRSWGYAGYVLQNGRRVSVMRGPEKDIIFIPGHRHDEN